MYTSVAPVAFVAFYGDVGGGADHRRIDCQLQGAKRAAAFVVFCGFIGRHRHFAGGMALIYLAAQIAWKVMEEASLSSAVVYVVEALGILAAAIVSVQISQTILEEEIIRDVHISGPSRIRRVLW